MRSPKKPRNATSAHEGFPAERRLTTLKTSMCQQESKFGDARERSRAEFAPGVEIAARLSVALGPDQVGSGSGPHVAQGFIV
jgi:hypothetical protein